MAHQMPIAIEREGPRKASGAFSVCFSWDEFHADRIRLSPDDAAFSNTAGGLVLQIEGFGDAAGAGDLEPRAVLAGVADDAVYRRVPRVEDDLRSLQSAYAIKRHSFIRRSPPAVTRPLQNLRVRRQLERPDHHGDFGVTIENNACESENVASDIGP